MVRVFPPRVGAPKQVAEIRALRGGACCINQLGRPTNPSQEQRAPSGRRDLDHSVAGVIAARRSHLVGPVLRDPIPHTAVIDPTVMPTVAPPHEDQTHDNANSDNDPDGHGDGSAPTVRTAPTFIELARSLNRCAIDAIASTSARPPRKRAHHHENHQHDQPEHAPLPRSLAFFDATLERPARPWPARARTPHSHSRRHTALRQPDLAAIRVVLALRPLSSRNWSGASDGAGSSGDAHARRVS